MVFALLPCEFCPLKKKDMKALVWIVFLQIAVTVFAPVSAADIKRQPFMAAGLPGKVSPTVKKIKLPNGIRLEYAEQGKRGGRTLLLLHGYTDSWKSWSTVLPHLPVDMHVIALSLRGHGNSDKPPAGYTPEQMAGDVALFLEAKKIRTAAVAGHSMGSIVAQRFALDYPAKLDALVLVASFAGMKSNTGVAGLLDAVDKLQDPIDPAFARAFQQSTVTKAVAGSFMQMAVEESLRLPAAVWKAALRGISTFDYTEALARIQAPVAIFWGDRDETAPRDDQHTLHRLLTQSVLKVYEGTGHALHWEEPARFAADLVQFLQTTHSK